MTYYHTHYIQFTIQSNVILSKNTAEVFPWNNCDKLIICFWIAEVVVWQIPQQARDDCTETTHGHDWNQIQLIGINWKQFLSGVVFNVACSHIIIMLHVAVTSKIVVVLLLVITLSCKKGWMCIEFLPSSPPPPLQVACSLLIDILCFHWQIIVWCHTVTWHLVYGEQHLSGVIKFMSKIWPSYFLSGFF